MNNTQIIIRAWKDAAFSEDAGDAIGALPANPAGVLELSDDALGLAQGAIGDTLTITRRICDPVISWLLACNGN